VTARLTPLDPTARLGAMARRVEELYAALLHLVDVAIAAADRRDVAKLVETIDSCDALQRQADAAVRELGAARRAASDPAAIDAIVRPALAIGERVRARYAELRTRTADTRGELGKQLDHVRHANTVATAYRPGTANRRTLNLVR
jgi:hypothetical protein